jgi:hypothetical protein
MYYIQYHTKFKDEDSEELHSIYDEFDSFYKDDPDLEEYSIEPGDVLDRRYIMTLAVKADSLIDAKYFINTELKDVVDAFGLQFKGVVDEDSYVNRFLGPLEALYTFQSYDYSPNSHWQKYITSDSLSLITEADKYINNKYEEALSPKAVLQTMLKARPDLSNKFPYIRAIITGTVKPTESQAKELARELKVSPIVFLEDINVSDDTISKLKQLASG